MAVFTWSMFWIWSALVGTAGGAGTAPWPWSCPPCARARPGRVSAAVTAAEARATLAVRAGRLRMDRCFTGDPPSRVDVSGVTQTRGGRPPQGGSGKRLHEGLLEQPDPVVDVVRLGARVVVGERRPVGVVPLLDLQAG